MSYVLFLLNNILYSSLPSVVTFSINDGKERKICQCSLAVHLLSGPVTSLQR